MSLQIQEHISLRDRTTFKVGGAARWFCEPASETEIAEALRWAKDKGCPWFLLGKGSNLVVSDSGYPGLVIHLGKHFSAILQSGNHLEARAGCSLHSLVLESVRLGLSGMENLAGIPGTVGGAVWMNAGAFDQEIGQTVIRVTSMDSNGILHERSREECQFGYRRSLFHGLDEVVLSCRVELAPADSTALRIQMDGILRRRREKQPTELPNAGSMFKRPPGTFAGFLIEKCGLKGLRHGKAAVSPKHANFLVNEGGASARDVWELSSEVIRKVREETGVTLEREVVFLGDFHS